MANKFKAATKLAGFLQYKDQFINTQRLYKCQSFLPCNFFCGKEESLDMDNAMHKSTEACICMNGYKFSTYGKAVVKFYNLLGKWE